MNLGDQEIKEENDLLALATLAGLSDDDTVKLIIALKSCRKENISYEDAIISKKAFGIATQKEAHRRVKQAEFTQPPKIESGSEFLDREFEQEKWVYQSLVEESNRVLLAAVYKTGKSTLLGNMLRADCDGGLLFNVFPSVQLDLGTRSLYLNLELPERTAYKYLSALNIKNSDAFRVWNGIGLEFDILNDEWFEWLGNQLVDNDIKRLYVDPLRMFHSAKNNDDDEVKVVTRRLDNFVNHAGLQHVTIAAHTPQPSRDDNPNDFVRALGSQGWSAWADSLWSLNRDDNGVRYFSARGRNGDLNPGSMTLVDGVLHLNGDTPKEVVRDKMREELLTFIGQHPDCNRTVIKQSVPGKDSEKIALLSELQSSGEIVVTQAGNSSLHRLRAEHVPGPS